MNADILAYILATNNFRAGAAELSADAAALKQIRFDAGIAPAAPAPSAPARTTRSATPREPDPAPAMLEGKPIETRPPEKSDNKPFFPEQTRAPYRATAPFKVTTLVDKRPALWSIAFLPDGKILFTERLPGSIRILDTDGKISEPVTGVAGLMTPGGLGIGVLDVVLDPHTPRTIGSSSHSSITSTAPTATPTSPARSSTKRGSPSAIRRSSSAPSRRCHPRGWGPRQAAVSRSRKMAVFVSIGDRSDSPPWDVAQKLDNHLGKVLHITQTARPRPTIRFWASRVPAGDLGLRACAARRVWRSTQATGRLWQHEHGPRGGDELNIVEKGKNYGWPVIVHGIDYPGTPIGEGVTPQGRAWRSRCTTGTR